MCICSFSTFFLNTSEWLFPIVTVIFPLLWIFFEKKTTLQDLFVPHGYKASVNLRQFVIIKVLYHDRYSKWNMSNHMLSKGEKRTKKPINTNVITRKPYGNVPWSTVVEIQFQSIQTYLLFPVFNLWNYPFCRLILCT